MSDTYRSQFESASDFEYNMQGYWGKHIAPFKIWIEAVELKPEEEREEELKRVLKEELDEYIPIHKFFDIFKTISGFYKIPHKKTLEEMDRCVDIINTAYADGTLTLDVLKQNINRLTDLKDPERLTHLKERYQKKKSGTDDVAY